MKGDEAARPGCGLPGEIDRAIEQAGLHVFRTSAMPSIQAGDLTSVLHACVS